MSDKTEEATPKRQRKAAEEGDSGGSTFAAQAAGFLVAAALLPGAAKVAVERISGETTGALAAAADGDPIAAATRMDALQLVIDVLAVTTPLLLAAAVTSAVAMLVQTGGAVSAQRLSLKWERLDPIQGVANLFSAQRGLTVLRALILAGVVGFIAEKTVLGHLGDVARTAGQPAYAGPLASEMVGTMLRAVAFVGLALGAVDLVVTKRAWSKRLRMSKDEVKREHKESEGDPQMKAARERAHHEMLASAAIGNVRTATVVIVNPTHLACALRYAPGGDAENPGDAAPVVVASGEGDLAARILEAARAYGVPIVRDVPLARALIELSIGDEIPEALYEAVAEILRAAAAEGTR